jgi:hypothetical protein
MSQNGVGVIAPPPMIRATRPLASVLHSFDRHEPERMVAEVGQKKRPEHQPRCESDFAQANGPAERGGVGARGVCRIRAPLLKLG